MLTALSRFTCIRNSPSEKQHFQTLDVLTDAKSTASKLRRHTYIKKVPQYVNSDTHTANNNSIQYTMLQNYSAYSVNANLSVHTVGKMKFSSN